MLSQGFRPQGPQGYGSLQMPPGGVSGASSFPGALPGPMHVPSLLGPPGPVPQQPPRPAAPLGGASSAGAAANVWTEHTAPNGRKYYHNKALGKSCWDKAPDSITLKVIPASFPPHLDLHSPSSLHASHKHAMSRRHLMSRFCFAKFECIVDCGHAGAEGCHTNKRLEGVHSPGRPQVLLQQNHKGVQVVYA